VSDETRQRVEQAIDELGYVPNLMAQRLRSKRTDTLALVITDITNPFWTTVVRGVEDVAIENGLSVILCNPQTQSVVAHLRCERSLLRLADVGTAVTKSLDRSLRGRSMPEDVLSFVKCLNLKKTRIGSGFTF